MRITEAYITERDHKAYELRLRGASYRQIAQQLGVSASTAHTSVQRALRRVSRQFALNHQDELQLELDRLDSLIRSLWALTVPRRVETGEYDADGDPITVEVPPSMDAIDRVLKVMAQRSKLLGLDAGQKISVEHSLSPEFSPTKKVPEMTPTQETYDLLKALGEAGVFEREAVGHIMKMLGQEEDIIDAVVVDDSDPSRPLELNSSPEPEVEEPPPWFEDDDDDEIAPPWRPDN